MKKKKLKINRIMLKSDIYWQNSLLLFCSERRQTMTIVDDRQTAMNLNYK